MGRLAAVWINATISGDADSVVISHAAPTFCIHVPIFDTSAASHSHRKMRCVNGLQIEPVGLGASGSSGLIGRAPPYAGKVAKRQLFIPFKS